MTSPQSEIKTAFTQKNVVPNKLSPSRIEDMKGTHFEIGSHSHIEKLNSNHKESYQIPLKTNKQFINDGNVAWE